MDGNKVNKDSETEPETALTKNESEIEKESEVEEEEIPRGNVTVKVYTTSREDYKIRFSSLSDVEHDSVVNTVMNSFNTLGQTSRGLKLATEEVTHVFNLDNVTCIQIIKD